MYAEYIFSWLLLPPSPHLVRVGIRELTPSPSQMYWLTRTGDQNAIIGLKQFGGRIILL